MRKFAFIFMVSLLSGTVTSANPNHPDKWVPMGNNPVKKSFVSAEKAILFETERGKAARCQLWPIFRLEADDSLQGVVSVKFEINCKLSPSNSSCSYSFILPPRPNGTGGRIAFSAVPNGKWQKIELKMDRSPSEMTHARQFQILVDAVADRASFLLRNIQFLKKDGTIYQFKPPAAEREKARHKLRPLGAPLAFTAAPGEKKEYHFAAEQLPEKSEVQYKLLNKNGRTLQHGTGKINSGKLSLTFQLPAGFYELDFPALNHRFGISVTAPGKTGKDKFFAIEAILETMKPEQYKNIMALLQRQQILHNRNWTNFQNLTSQGKYNSQADHFYREANSSQIRSVFVFNDFPDVLDGIFTDSRKSLPGKLIPLDSFLEDMVKSRKGSIEGFHILNEYDAVKVPAEACLPSIKTAAWAMRNQKDISLLGAAFCTGNSSAFRYSIAENLLDLIDIFCIQTYLEPEAIEPLIQEYRAGMASHPKAFMPLWITESGKPWDSGNNSKAGLTRRPNRQEDQISALWITMKAVESKACGVERYYPFVLPFFPQRHENFGMLDYYGTPLRSLHCYFTAADLLKGKRYCGDWKNKPVSLNKARVFADQEEAVIVFYSGKNNVQNTSLDISELPQGKALASDGSPLRPRKGRLSFDDGMAYWVFPAAELSNLKMQTQTPARKLLLQSENYKPITRKYTPIVYRYDFRKCRAQWRSPAGYFLPEDGKMHFLITNFSNSVQKTTPRVIVPAGVKVLSKLPETITLPPRSETSLSFEIQTALPQSSVKIGDQAHPLSFTTVPLLNLTTARQMALQFRKSERWKQNANGLQTFRYDKTEDAMEVRTDFRTKKTGDNWSFPEYHFTKNEKQKGLIGVAFEFRYEKKTSSTKPLFPALMLVCHGSSMEMYPLSQVDTTWRHYLIPVAGREDKPFDLLRLGMGSNEKDLTFKFRNIKLIFNTPAPQEKKQKIKLTAPPAGACLYQHTPEQNKFFQNKSFRTSRKLDWLHLTQSADDDRTKPAFLSFTWSPGSSEPLFPEAAESEDFQNGVLRFCTNADNTSALFHSLKSGSRYFWRLCNPAGEQVSETGFFETAPELPRWIWLEGCSNVRDFGGWDCMTGKKIRQGLIYRGGELNGHMNITATARHFLLHSLNIKSDLDLRSAEELQMLPENSQIYPPEINCYSVPLRPYGDITLPEQKELYASAFRILSDPQNLPCYLHCWGGADRTGTLCFLLQALLGAEETSLQKDYEATSLSIWGVRTCKGQEFKDFRKKLNSFAPGKSLQEQSRAYFSACGITRQEISSFENLFLA